MNRSFLKSLRWMFVVALFVRLVFCWLLLEERLDPAQGHWKFGWWVGRIAHSIYEGRGFSSPLWEPTGPTAQVGPAFPYLVALCMKLFGGYTAQSALAVLALNSLFAALTVVPIFLIAKRFFSERAAYVAGWAWVFFPYSIHVSATRIYENALTCMLASFLLLQTLELEDSRRFRDWLVWGALWGVAGLVSAALLAPLPFLGLWLVARRYKKGLRWFLPAVSSALVFFAFVAPWTIRNWQEFHRFIPFRDNFWLEMHVGNNGDTSDPWPEANSPDNTPAEWEQWKRLGEIRYMDAKKLEAKGFIREHPGSFAWLSIRRAVYVWTGFWSFDPKYFMRDNPPFRIAILLNTILTLLALGGLRYAQRKGKNRAVVPLTIVLLTFPMVYYITHPAMDYRHPIDPVLVVLSCYCVVEWQAGRAAKKQSTGVVAVPADPS